MEHRGNERACICGRFFLLFLRVMSQLTWWGFKCETIARATILPKVIFSSCLINPDVAAMYHAQNSQIQSLKTPPPSLCHPVEATFSGSPPGLRHVLADSIVQQPVSLPLTGLAALSVSWGFVPLCDLNPVTLMLLLSFSACFSPRCIYKCLPHG